MLLLLLIPGSQILIYPILWILIPSESTVTAQAQTDRPRSSLTPDRRQGWQPATAVGSSAVGEADGRPDHRIAP